MYKGKKDKLPELGEYYTKDPGWAGGTEFRYILRQFYFNDRLNDLLNLHYNEDEKVAFNLYPEIPKKLSLWKIFKNRKAIDNFINYQCNIYAPTYVERKILKEMRSDIHRLYTKQQAYYLVPLLVINFYLFKGTIGLSLTFLSWLYFTTHDTLGDIVFMFNSNSYLMKYQINIFYKLGRDTTDFVNYIKADKDEKVLKYNKNKEYYDKFFAKNLYAIKIEPEDKLFNYLDSYGKVDFHQRMLEIYEKQREDKEKNKSKQKI